MLLNDQYVAEEMKKSKLPEEDNAMTYGSLKKLVREKTFLKK